MKSQKITRKGSSRRRFLKTGLGSLGLVAPLAGVPAAAAPPQGCGPIAPVLPPSPPWVKDLIIYEIATKGFTSPHGPESGTFNSLRARLPYLEDLGVTGIWLTGYSLCDSRHFYNIWTQYAVTEPDRIDPSLGTEAEFKALIDDAHRRGIKVFLDVITHGLMSNSPVIRRHPEWFRGGSWGMIDFDWFGGHADLDAWWIKIWTDYVVKFGVDGYRLDVFIYRPDLWERIRHNAAAAGHPIAIFEEDDSPIPGVTDFCQHEYRLTTGGGAADHLWNDVLLQDVPGFYRRKFGKAGNYQVEIQFQDDGSRVRGNTQGEGTLKVRLEGLAADKVPRRKHAFFTPVPDGIPDVALLVDNAPARPIENLIVTDDMDGRWELHPASRGHLAVEWLEPPSSAGALRTSPLRVYVATLGHGWPSIQLSSHDNGWEGFPLGKNPYVAQGSRALFGYSFLFTPMVPVFFSGEEFDASFRPLPTLSPHLYGGKDAGKGRWLYGSMIDWAELDHPEHRGMFEDVRAMMAVRKREAAVLSAIPYREEPQLAAVPCESDVPVPVPYVRWNNRCAILVAANRNTSRDASLKLKIPLREMGFTAQAKYTVTRLWPEGETRVCTEEELASFTCTVRHDKSRQGGLCVFKIEPGIGSGS